MQSIEWTVVDIRRPNENLMARFLIKCRNIHTFRFKMIYCSTPSHLCTIGWRELDPQLAQVINCILESPKLHFLELCMWKNFPLQNLLFNRNLKHLVIKGVNKYPLIVPHVINQPSTRHMLSKNEKSD